MARNPWKKLLSNVKLAAATPGASHQTHLVMKDVKRDGRKVEITEHDLRLQFQKQHGRCFWLGIQLNPDDIYTAHNPLSMSVDRLDNNIDYTPENIVITCRFANLGRGSATIDTMQHLVDQVKNPTSHGSAEFIEFN